MLLLYQHVQDKIRSFRLGPPETDEIDPGLISLLELSDVCSVLVSFIALIKTKSLLHAKIPYLLFIVALLEEPNF